MRNEAIAIRTASNGSDFLPKTDRTEAAALLRQYVDVRVRFVQSRTLEPGRVKIVVSQTQEIQDRLWNMAVTNARKAMNSDVAALYIDSLNAVNGIPASRVASGFKRDFRAKFGTCSTA